MDEQILKKLDEQAARLEQVYQSAEKTRKYLLTTLWVTIILFVVPLLGLLFVIPSFLNMAVPTDLLEGL